MTSANGKYILSTLNTRPRTLGLAKFSTMVFLSILAGWGPPAVAEIIFEENFDQQPDWQLIDGDESCNNISASCDGTPPINWTYYRSSESWHPSEGFPSHKPSQAINSDHPRGGNGKSWVRHHEADLDTSESRFSDDSMLLKALDRDYEDIYVSFWIRFDPAWRWVSSGNAKFKLLRIYHFDGPDSVANPWDYFSDGDSGPIFIFDVKFSNKWGFRSTYSARCDPQESVYYCNPSRAWEGDHLWSGSPTFEESLGNGNWHQIKIRVKMNSALGAADGLFTVWLDGVEQYSFTDIPWREAGSSESIGWNMVGIGGNTTNWFSDPSNRDEQWYAIDDLVISTASVAEDIPSPPQPPTNLQIN